MVKGVAGSDRSVAQFWRAAWIVFWASWVLLGMSLLVEFGGFERVVEVAAFLAFGVVLVDVTRRSLRR